MARARQGFNCNLCHAPLAFDDVKNKCAACRAPKVSAARKAINADYRAERFGRVVSVEPVDKGPTLTPVALTGGGEALVNEDGEPIN